MMMMMCPDVVPYINNYREKKKDSFLVLFISLLFPCIVIVVLYMEPEPCEYSSIRFFGPRLEKGVCYTIRLFTKTMNRFIVKASKPMWHKIILELSEGELQFFLGILFLGILISLFDFSDSTVNSPVDISNNSSLEGNIRQRELGSFPVSVCSCRPYRLKASVSDQQQFLRNSHYVRHRKDKIGTRPRSPLGLRHKDQTPLLSQRSLTSMDQSPGNVAKDKPPPNECSVGDKTRLCEKVPPLKLSLLHSCSSTDSSPVSVFDSRPGSTRKNESSNQENKGENDSSLERPNKLSLTSGQRQFNFPKKKKEPVQNRCKNFPKEDRLGKPGISSTTTIVKQSRFCMGSTIYKSGIPRPSSLIAAHMKKISSVYLKKSSGFRLAPKKTDNDTVSELPNMHTIMMNLPEDVNEALVYLETFKSIWKKKCKTPKETKILEDLKSAILYFRNLSQAKQ